MCFGFCLCRVLLCLLLLHLQWIEVCTRTKDFSESMSILMLLWDFNPKRAYPKRKCGKADKIDLLKDNRNGKWQKKMIQLQKYILSNVLQKPFIFSQYFGPCYHHVIVARLYSLLRKYSLSKYSIHINVVFVFIENSGMFKHAFRCIRCHQCCVH